MAELAIFILYQNFLLQQQWWHNAVTGVHGVTEHNERALQSLSLFAAQTNFTEAGELTLLIGESQVAFLEDMMWEQGYLEAAQMAGAFQLLRSNDLIWSRLMRSYLMVERPPTFDLLAWNADATRMPYRMHSEYLRKRFLRNDLAEGRYLVAGRPVALSDIRVPLFAVATETDHVAPWRSVFKCHLLMDTDTTFVLTSGGHNAGIVSEPDRKDRHYRMALKRETDRYLDPETWAADAVEHLGSWWPAWVEWLAGHSDQTTQPPSMGAPEKGLRILGPAPGRYVLER
jgi:polyhydroxyalkanoate synthase